ncbi:MAG TPA: PIG-L family deacetylase [Bryobacteraceae bacterium]|jgi:LmbE family N-acetylglucosaminyl deacetylase|nr:PIG-L family deacetylase [Bryobacteraceae bacterium]
MEKMFGLRARFLLLAVSVVLAVPLSAAPIFSGTPEIEQSLHKLNELGSVLMIAAHPDDERTPVLAYFARGRHMRTAYLSATRGEGGQNLIGSEQGAQLGIIRTQELLAARRIDGAQQFFTRAIDFGFTRTPEETLEKWGRERLLSDMVWVIRSYRPDVIILCFTGTPRDGHGQHQASAIVGKEAFEVAGDPNRFPEQLKYVQPWKAKRLALSVFNFPPQGQAPGGRGGAQAAAPPAPDEPPLPTGPRVNDDTGAYNPVLGYSYEEIAALSRSQHRSQGMGGVGRVGSVETGYVILSGPPTTKDLFDGIDTTWNRLPGGAAVGAILAEALRAFEPAHPENVASQLVKARPLIAAMTDPLARIKLAELDEAIANCAGLFVEAQPSAPEVTPGSKLTVTTTVVNRSSVPIRLEGARFEGMFTGDLTVEAAKLEFNKSKLVKADRQVPASQPYTQPYWLVKARSNDVYTVDDQTKIGLPDNPPILEVRLRLSLDGTPFEVVRPLQYRYADRAQGERVRPLVVIPAVAVNLPEAVAVFPNADARKVDVSVRANVARAEGELRLNVPTGWKVEPKSSPFRISTVGEQQELTFTVTPPQADATAWLQAVASVGGRNIDSGVQVISYPHIPDQTLLIASDVKLVRADIRVTAHKIGYIMGAGDEMPDALRQMGVEVTLLSQSDLEKGDLTRFDAIVAGVRAYNVRSDIRTNQQRLLDYVKNGGTYIVQYNTGDNSLSVGPYAFTAPPGNKYRVTVEEAPVILPHVDSRLLQTPNHITPKDFDGWVQERGLYFASKWDPRYETVLSSKDPGEEAIAGGELWTRYGKGVYIFTAYSWFRQLPSGVPGAYRLFANLLSAK